MEIVYIETSLVSLLASDLSQNLITAAKQQITREWWRVRRQAFQCVTSDQTLMEASRGDPAQAERRLAEIADLPSLPVTPDAEALAADFLGTGALPTAARADAVHLAVATAAQVNYLLTWNCRHLANAQILRRLEIEADRVGWLLPTVCTPMGLMGETSYDIGSDS